MLQLQNETPFNASLMLLPDSEGVDTVFAVIKGTLAIGRNGHLSLPEVQVPIALADEHHGDPATTSIRTASDVCLGKPGTDVLVTGSACAPNESPTWQSDVTLIAAGLTKTVRVFGDRAWEMTGPTARIAWIEPFVHMPLVWERAFGGRDESTQHPATDTRNPVGRGFRASGSKKPIAGTALPNVENPAALIDSPTAKPAPAGFAPLSPHWDDRRAYAGTYDERWQKERAPYLPADFDPRFFQLAPRDSIVPGRLRGGEAFELHGVRPNEPLRFLLPALDVEITCRLDSSEETKPALLDTLTIDADTAQLILVWRAALRCDKKALKVREVRINLLRGTTEA